MIPPDVSDDDLVHREDVLLYLTTRYDRASATLKDAQWDSFRSFVQLWLETFDWRTEQGRARYLAIDPAQRRQRFERFERQAGSWDVTLDFPVGERMSPERQEREDWRRRFARDRARFEERTRAASAAWESLRQFLEAENRLRFMPEHLREAYRVLDISPASSLAAARKRYRGLAKKLHQDVTGRHQEMATLNDAWEKVLAFFLS